MLTEKATFDKQRPEENTTAYILRFLSEAKLAYPTAWVMGEEGKIVSFLKGFTDRAFAGYLLRTVQGNTLGTGTEVALEKEAEQKKEHQVMDREPIEVGAAQTNQKSCTTTGTEMSQHLEAKKRAQAVLWTTHTDAQRTMNLNPNHCANKELTGSRPTNLRMLQRGRPLPKCFSVSS